MNPFETKHGVSFAWTFDNLTTPKKIVTEQHSFRDFGLYPAGIVIEPPAVATSGIYVPGMDGEIDTTASLDGVVHYKNRKATFRFKAIDAKNSYIETYHKLLRILHGQTASVVLDDDPRGYYTGRWSVDKPEYDSKLGVAYFIITGNCKPYQYDYLSTGHPWLWYPFRFTRDSIRRDYSAITLQAQFKPLIAVVGSPHDAGLYELTGGVYVLTNDDEPQDGKTYYMLHGSTNNTVRLYTSEYPTAPTIKLLEKQNVGNVSVTYTNTNGATKTVTLEDVNDSVFLSDLVLCSLRKGKEIVNLYVTLGAISTTPDVSLSATINVDYETGRL